MLFRSPIIGHVEEHVESSKVSSIPRETVFSAVALAEGSAIFLDDFPDNFSLYKWKLLDRQYLNSFPHLVAVQLRLAPKTISQHFHTKEAKRLKIHRVDAALEE